MEKRQIDLIEESILVMKKFSDLRRLYRNNALSFSKVEEFVDDRGKSCLFRLKEMCHELFRNSESASYKEKLYDITVGYIFHEAMKLRENVYQLEYYRPKTFMVKDKVGEKEKKILKEMEYLIVKAEKRLKEGFLELKKLIKELSEQLKDLILTYRNNQLLPRFILENQKIFVSVYGRKRLGEMVRELFSDGKKKLFFLAGLSYLSSDYYDEARLAFRNALDSGNLRKEALFYYHYASAFACYLKGKIKQSVISAQKALEASNIKTVPSQLVENLHGLISDLKREQKTKRHI
ncbi:MAG: hypothetical protein NZ583_07115 [Desulfobacterota bacterium]|nr:hypothetical protein [Thermodesulfobacteriota bacterium]